MNSRKNNKDNKTVWYVCLAVIALLAIATIFVTGTPYYAAGDMTVTVILQQEMQFKVYDGNDILYYDNVNGRYHFTQAFFNTFFTIAYYDENGDDVTGNVPDLAYDDIEIIPQTGVTSCKDTGRYVFEWSFVNDQAGYIYQKEIIVPDKFQFVIYSSIDNGFIGYKQNKVFNDILDVFTYDKIFAVSGFSGFLQIQSFIDEVYAAWLADMGAAQSERYRNFFLGSIFTLDGRPISSANATGNALIFRFEFTQDVERLARTGEDGSADNNVGYSAVEKWNTGDPDNVSLFSSLESEIDAVNALINNISVYALSAESDLGYTLTPDEYTLEEEKKVLYYNNADKTLYKLPDGSVRAEYAYADVNDDRPITYELTLDLSERALYNISFKNSATASETYASGGRIIKVAIGYDNRTPYEAVYGEGSTMFLPVAGDDMAAQSISAGKLTHIYGTLYRLNTPFIYNNVYHAYVVCNQYATEVNPYLPGLIPKYGTLSDPNFPDSPGLIELASIYREMNSYNNVYASLEDAAIQKKAVYYAYLEVSGDVQETYIPIPVYYCLNMLSSAPEDGYTELAPYVILPREMKEGYAENYTNSDIVAKIDRINPIFNSTDIGVSPTYDFKVLPFSSAKPYDATSTLKIPIMLNRDEGNVLGNTTYFYNFTVELLGNYFDKDGRITSEPWSWQDEGGYVIDNPWGPLSRENFIIDMGPPKIYAFPEGYNVMNFRIYMSPNNAMSETEIELFQYNITTNYYYLLQGLISAYVTDHTRVGTLPGQVEFFPAIEYFDGATWIEITGDDLDTAILGVAKDSVKNIRIRNTIITKTQISVSFNDSVLGSGVVTVKYGNNMLEEIYKNIVIKNYYHSASIIVESLFTITSFDDTILSSGTFKYLDILRFMSEQLDSGLSVHADIANNIQTPLQPGDYKIKISGYMALTVGTKYSQTLLINPCYSGVAFDGSEIILTITPATVTYGIDEQEKDFGENDPDVSQAYILSGYRDSDRDKISITRAPGEYAGEYPYSLKFDDSISTFYNQTSDSSKENRLIINKSDLNLDFSNQSKFTYADVYNGADNINNVIRIEKTAGGSSPYFTVPYGVFPNTKGFNDMYYYTVEITFAPGFENPYFTGLAIGFTLTLTIADINAGSKGYAYTCSFNTPDSQLIDSLNLVYDIQNTVFAISKRIMQLDFSTGNASLSVEKTYDESQLSASFSPNSGGSNLQMSIAFPYGEKYINFVMKGYDKNAIDDSDMLNNIKAGEKYLFVTSITMEEGYDSDNYEFVIIRAKGNILQRKYHYITGANENDNVKIYDGLPYSFDFYQSMIYNLLPGHYVDAPSLKFVTATVAYSFSPINLGLSVSGFIIRDAQGNDVTDSYIINNALCNYGSARILLRQISFYGEDIETVYDGNNFYIDVNTGKLYSIDGGQDIYIDTFGFGLKSSVVEYIDTEKEKSTTAMANEPTSNSAVNSYSYGGDNYLRINISKLNKPGLSFTDGNFYYLRRSDNTVIRDRTLIRNLLGYVENGTATVTAGAPPYITYQQTNYYVIEVGVERIQLGALYYYLERSNELGVVHQNAANLAGIKAGVDNGTLLFSDGITTSIEYQGNDYYLIPFSFANGMIQAGKDYYFRLDSGVMKELVNSSNGEYIRSESLSPYVNMYLNSSFINSAERFYFYDVSAGKILTNNAIIARLVRYISDGSVTLGTDKHLLFDKKEYILCDAGAQTAISSGSGSRCYYIDISSNPLLVEDSALIAVFNAKSANVFTYNGKVYMRKSADETNGVFYTGKRYYFIKYNATAYVLVDENALVAGDTYSGNLASVNGNAGTQRLEESPVYYITIGGDRNTKYDITFNVNILIKKRPVVLNFNDSAFVLSKIYDGELYSAAVTQSDNTTAYITNLLYGKGHTVALSAATANASAGNGKLLVFNTGSIIFYDSQNNNVSANYTLSEPVQTYVDIHKRQVTLLIYSDAANAEKADNNSDGIWDKYYNKTKYEIAVTKAMFTPTYPGDGLLTGIVAKHSISAGALVTLDANVFTLDGGGNVIYESGGRFILPKALSYKSGVSLQIIEMQGTAMDVTSNYDITLSSGNTVQILPKAVEVDMQLQYPTENMTFVYQGRLLEFPVTTAMLGTAVVYGDTVVSDTKFVSTQKTHGNDISLTNPSGVLINYTGSPYDDDVYSLNYSVSYKTYTITISKRNLNMDINEIYSMAQRTKIYDGNIYTINMVNGMVSNTAANSGLAAGHSVSGSIFTADGLVAYSGIDTVTNKLLTYSWLAVYDEYDADVMDNYNITNATSYALINRRVLEIKINIAGDTVQQLVYNAQKMSFTLTDAMAEKGAAHIPQNEGLIAIDGIVSALSYRRTISDTVYLYNLNSVTQSEGELVIRRDGQLENMAANYIVTYINARVEIIARKLIITVIKSLTDAYYDSVNRRIISGFSDIYNAEVFTVNFQYYFDSGLDGRFIIDGVNNFGLVAGHRFAAGRRKTSVNTADIVKLTDDIGLTILNGADGAVTSNYDCIYADSYYEIQRRPIKLDVALTAQGWNAAYVFDGNGTHYYKYDYNRKKFEITLTDSMVVMSYYQLPAGQTITAGKLTTADAEVLRGASGEVLPKAMIWASNLVITSQSGNVNVTSNYIIDTSSVGLNFEERFVKYIPRVLVIDIGTGSSPAVSYSKSYDGLPFELSVTDNMAVNTKFGINSGLVGDVDEQWGTVTNRDVIRQYSGKLSTSDANVLLKAGVASAQRLYSNNALVIESPDRARTTTHNYDIYYYYNIVTVELWAAIYAEILNGNPDLTATPYEANLPTATITKQNVTFTLNTANKIRKYYDGSELNITVEYYQQTRNSGTLTWLSGNAVTDNLSSALTVTGLVQGQGARIRIYGTATGAIIGEVHSAKPTFFDESSLVITNGNANNYSFSYYTSSSIILQRPIIIDVNAAGGVKEIGYIGNFIFINITNAMVKATTLDASSIVSVGNGLPLVLTNNIAGGTLRSDGMNAGINYMLQKPDGNTDANWVKIIIEDAASHDVTAQYAITYATNTINIKQLPINISLASGISKVYDGTPFVLQLSQGTVNVAGLLPGHAIYSGTVFTSGKNVTKHEASCDLRTIKVRANINGSEVDVTANYTFAFTGGELEITSRGLVVEATEDYLKSASDNYYVELLRRNYRFVSGGVNTGPCGADNINITGYKVKNIINGISGFPYLDADGDPILLYIYDIVIDNPNYHIITTVNVNEVSGRVVTVYAFDGSKYTFTTETEASTQTRTAKGFTIFGLIKIVEPAIRVSDNEAVESIFGALGVRYTYDGREKIPVYEILGLYDVSVVHNVYFAKMTRINSLTTENLSDFTLGTETTDKPLDAGIYRMRIESADPNYSKWEGRIIYIRILPASPSISFAGSGEQVYGSVIDITASVSSSAGLYQSLQTTITADGAYTYPQAGTYTVTAKYNTDKSNANYLAVESSIKITILKKALTVDYGNITGFVYDGTIKPLNVTLNRDGIIAADAGSLLNSNLSVAVTRGAAASSLLNAGEYVLTVSLKNSYGSEHNNYYISNNTASVSIAKRPLKIFALINEMSRLTIDEGDAFSVTLSYSGFAGAENKNSLITAAYLPYYPKKAVNEYEIMPAGATSDNYQIEYVPAYLTILKKVKAELVSEDLNAVIEGEYGAYAQLSCNIIEADVNNPSFYSLFRLIERNYNGTDLMKNYEAAKLYNLILSNDDDTNTGMKTIRLRLDESLASKNNFMIVGVDSEGNTKLISAYMDNGYLVFSTENIEDYVIFTYKSGMSPIGTLLLIVLPIAAVLLGVSLYMLLRKKY